MYLEVHVPDYLRPILTTYNMVRLKDIINFIWAV